MRLFIAPFLVSLSIAVYSQSQQPDASQIKLNLKKLSFLGSVLYVAAHPDDENTRVITYLVGERLASTAYLSMTRGDGGQNLIGPEIRDQLGLIRTQELIVARKLDGGQQFFTRANDFGYSKSADETFKIWNKDEILSDVVRVYRQYQPDVVLTRFPPDQRAGHGHHTASAILAQEAFDLSGLSTAYPDQLASLPVWQPKRVYTNTGRFFSNDINENTPGVTTLNVGGYNQLLGQSYSEIAAVSRSQHKSQGFGVPSRRGDAQEFFELVKGQPAQKDIFDGINTTWSRVIGGDKVQPLIDKAIKEFNFEQPSLSVPMLLQIRKAIRNVESGVWRDRKLKEVEQLIKDCMGLYVEATGNTYWASPGQNVTLSFELINRSSIPASIQQISSPDLSLDTLSTGILVNNSPFTFKTTKAIKDSKTYSDPYWLREPHSAGLFTVNDPNLIGKPENEAAVRIMVRLMISGEPLDIYTPVVYKWTDPVKGELYRPFEIVPPVFLNLSESVLIFNSDDSRQLKVLVKASGGAFSGSLRLNLPEGWRSEPKSIPISLTKRNEEQNHSFTIFPSQKEMIGTMRAEFVSGNTVYDYAIQTIQYDHIPVQTLLPKAEARIVRVDLRKEGKVVGYIKGAGDDIPSALRNIGYEVVELKNGEITLANIKNLDAIVLGIRAFNTNDRLRYSMPDLLEYVNGGGVLLVQYNTNIELSNDKLSPYKLRISRERVSEEDAEVRILKPDHPALTFPNKITKLDFDGWVQERGLYFPDTWDTQFEALLSMNDQGENPREGSLLIAQYGKGYYIYTGLSFFRQLPEGVPGAYKLFANLISLRKQVVNTQPASDQPVKNTSKKKSKP